MTTSQEIGAMAAAHGCSTVYASKRTKVAHLAENANTASFCGIEGPWLGTGTQDEWDEAERRPLCTNCAGWVLFRGWATCAHTGSRR